MMFFVIIPTVTLVFEGSYLKLRPRGGVYEINLSRFFAETFSGRNILETCSPPHAWTSPFVQKIIEHLWGAPGRSKVIASAQNRWFSLDLVDFCKGNYNGEPRGIDFRSVWSKSGARYSDKSFSPVPSHRRTATSPNIAVRKCLRAKPQSIYFMTPPPPMLLSAFKFISELTSEGESIHFFIKTPLQSAAGEKMHLACYTREIMQFWVCFLQ